ncbi:MAG TPA: hypothetical protein VIM24_01650, partial [Candidatus Limnocylindrales bacterium]
SFAAAGDDPALSYAAARDGYELARHLGYRGEGFYLLNNAIESAIHIGDWDWAAATLDEAEAAGLMPQDTVPRLRHAQLAGLRGARGAQVDDLLDAIAANLGDVTEIQAHSVVQEVGGELALARGEIEEGYRLSIGAFRLNPAPDSAALLRAGRAAGWLGDLVALREARQLIDGVPGRVPAAWRLEMDAAIAALEGRRAEAISLFRDALHGLRELGLDYERAIAAVNSMKMVGPNVAELRDAVDEAEATFRRLGATPMLARLAEARAGFPRGSGDSSSAVDGSAGAGGGADAARIPSVGRGV